jgi:hypothetical protein
MALRTSPTTTRKAVKTPKDFDVKNFCKRFRVVRPDLTRMIGYSLRSIDKWAAGERIAAAPKRRLEEAQRLMDALADIMEPKAVGEWLKTPNDAFEGSTPLQVIERGESDRIWRMIFLVETGEPV